MGQTWLGAGEKPNSKANGDGYAAALTKLFKRNPAEHERLNSVNAPQYILNELARCILAEIDFFPSQRHDRKSGCPRLRGTHYGWDNFLRRYLGRHLFPLFLAIAIDSVPQKQHFCRISWSTTINDQLNPHDEGEQGAQGPSKNGSIQAIQTDQGSSASSGREAS